MDERDLKRRGIRADTAGVTALEYGITASLIGLVLLSLFRGFGVILDGVGASLASLLAGVGTAT